MTLLAIAEVMSGEALVSPGGPVDRDTTLPDEVLLWQQILQFASIAPGDENAPPVDARIEELVSPI
jgi:hypothetical protein